MTTTLLVVDTETGGLDPAHHCIIDLAARVMVIEAGDVTISDDTFELKIKPDLPVHPHAAKVNGYAPADWADAMAPQEALRRFRGFVQEQCNMHDRPMWAGCNPVFDLKFYNSDRQRHDEAEPTGLHYRVVDVASMALPLLFAGKVPTVALRHLRAWAGCGGEQSHTAMGDVDDTCEVIGALLLEYGS